MSQHLREMGERIETLLEGIKGANPVTARAKAEELVRTIVQLYGDGLARVLEIVDETAGDASPGIFAQLAQDKLVSGLLLLHDLHPQTLEERVHGALERVRPYLKSHEGGVRITSIANGIVSLKMEGSCHGCPSSAETVRVAIEQAILDAAPEITEVRAEGVRDAGSGLRIMSEWLPMPEPSDISPYHLDVNGTPAVVMRNEDEVYAFRSQCPRCFRGLSGASVTWPMLQCGGCGTRYDLSGTSPGGLEQFAVSMDGSKMQLAIPVTS